MLLDLPASWAAVLAPALQAPSFQKLQAFVDDERQKHPGQIFPAEDQVFSALKATAFDDVTVVVVGQDPYHDDGQAHGLAFSVPADKKAPPSLKNLFKEMATDIGVTRTNPHLVDWAAQGVLLLNTVLTVRAHEAGSHQKKGWESFTDAVIAAVSARAAPAVFVLWGAAAKKKKALIDARHAVVEGAHPSPLSAQLFMGSKPFSAINAALKSQGHPPINWA